MKTLIISGSHRINSQSIKVSKWLAAALAEKGSQADILELAGSDIPLWDEAAWNPTSDLSKQMGPYLDRVTAADAFIIVAPEWAGMAPAALKNFLLYVASKHAAHKPVLLVGVSSGRGGTYPVAELRGSGFKNNRIICIPDHLIVQFAEGVMNTPALDDGSEADQFIKKRAVYSLGVLLAYAKALKGMREETGGLLDPAYPFGM